MTKWPGCAAACFLILSFGLCERAGARPAPLPQSFNQTLSNNAPLAFGMDLANTAAALRTSLVHVGGTPDDGIYLAWRNVGGSGFFDRRDRLYLQFRHGRLTGWKGDWGRNWMWR